MLDRTKLDQASQDLLAAADIKESRPHMQMDFFGANGACCIAGSLVLALGGDESYRSVHEHFVKNEKFKAARAKFEKFVDNDICNYNNIHTKDECVTAMRDAAFS